MDASEFLKIPIRKSVLKPSNELRCRIICSRDLAQLDPVSIVHRKDANRGAARWCKAHEEKILQREMVLPNITPWMKQRDHLARCGIDARKVWAFVKVAVL